MLDNRMGWVNRRRRKQPQFRRVRHTSFEIDDGKLYDIGMTITGQKKGSDEMSSHLGVLLCLSVTSSSLLFPDPSFVGLSLLTEAWNVLCLGNSIPGTGT